MRKFGLKLIGIFFITIFCIAPLCAVEFNQENNKIDANAIEIKKVNDDSQIADDNLKMEYFDKLYIHVDDVVRGEPIVVDVSTADFISCGVSVMFKGINFLWLEKGHGQLTLDSYGLEEGTYQITVQSQMYTKPEYKLEPASTTFTVKAA